MKQISNKEYEKYHILYENMASLKKLLRDHV